MHLRKKTVRALVLIGNIYSKTGYYEKAKSTFEDALTIQGLKDRQRAVLYQSIAKNDYLFHYNNDAEHGFKNALNVDEELRLEFQADTLYRLANSCFRQGKQKEGDQLLHKIEEALTKDHNRYEEFRAKSMISRGVFLYKPFHDGMIWEGFQLLKKFGIQIELIELAHEVSDYYYVNSNYEKAYDYLSLAKRQKKNIVE
ncbi:tetratricopeptide repeat protein [Geomicrobium sp. JCM 19055]|uniref:tetratricopeptide repeat protein n=1 Tax=Geomicrobium sp. JCM 19055 TaxID=1460649 RepID=UPI00187CFBC2|nr:tetratricopeptide repeat protein [Geomicrobium sp. JCM 19055]